MKDALVAFATALTNIVFPVPGDQLEVHQVQLAYLGDHKAEHHGEDQYRSWYIVPSNHQLPLSKRRELVAHLLHGQLDSLPDLLFLRIQSTNIRILDIRFLISPKHRN